MPLDRFVHFTKGTGPTDDQVESVVRNFFGDAATSIEWNEDRWLVSLPGKPTWVFEGIEPDLTPRLRNTERWIEVYVGPTLDVITRRQDEFTNALSKGLAECFARFWEGKIDQ